MVSVVIGLLVSRSLNNKVEVDLPVVAEAVVGVVLDLPESRIASRPGVTAADPDINVLDGDVP